MKIVIFGASGHTGQIVVRNALEKGYEVVAFVRNPQSLRIKNKNLLIFVGNIRNHDQVTAAIKGSQAVISTLGNNTRSVFLESNTVLSQGVQNIVYAMEKINVKRVLFISSFGVSDEVFFPEKLILKTILKNIFADTFRQEKIITESALDYTIVRPSRLTNENTLREYKTGERLYINPLSHISRTAVAHFLLTELENREFSRRIVTISY